MNQLYLLGYTVDDEVCLVYLEAVGPHENFYRDIKRSYACWRRRAVRCERATLFVQEGRGRPLRFGARQCQTDQWQRQRYNISYSPV